MATGISKSFSGYAERDVGGYGKFALYIQFSMAETYDTATRKSDLLFSDFQIKAVDPQANNTSFVGGSITVTVNGTAYTIFSAPANEGIYKVTANGSYNTVLVNSTGEAWSYNLSGLSRGNDGKLSVEVGWDGITLNNWYSGFGITVSGTETVTLTTVAASYGLSISAGTGSTITVIRTGSPNQGAFTGGLNHGDVIYYGDVLTITFGASTGYDLGDHKVNGETLISGETHIVYDDVSVISDATVKSYKLRISAGEGSTINVSRTESPLQNADISDLNNNADIYYNDKLEITFSAETGYNLTTTQVNNNDFSGGEYTVKGDVSVASAASLKSYILTITPQDAHSIISVYKDGSALLSGDTIYHFDALSITVTAQGGYKIKSAEINGTSLTPDVENSYEVSGDVIIVATSSALGFVYIQDGGATPSPYIIYVGSEDGLSLERYRVYIGTESNGVIPY